MEGGEGLLGAVFVARPDPVRLVGTENTAATRAPLCDSLTGAVAAIRSGVESLLAVCERERCDCSRTLNGVPIWSRSQLTSCPEKLWGTPIPSTHARVL